MTYLFLFFCSKFAITVPYLLPAQYRSYTSHHHNKATSHTNPLPTSNISSPALGKDDPNTVTPMSLPQVLRSQAAAPPVYLLAIALVPLGVAIFITATRYTDYRHHGFDIIFGALIGFVAAYGSFRWYHAPIRKGAGWSWGPRSKDRAWAVGFGIQGYAGDDGSMSSEYGLKDHDEDLEMGQGVGSVR